MPPTANTTAPACGTAAHTRGSCVIAHQASRLVQPMRATNSTPQPNSFATRLGQILG